MPLRGEHSVRVELLVGKDGLVRKAQCISGPAVLVQSVLEAVRQWKFPPTLERGQAVEVLTQMDAEVEHQERVRFAGVALGAPVYKAPVAGGASPRLGGVVGGSGRRVAPEVQAARLVHRVDPVVTSAVVGGRVRFNAVIGKDGTVQNLTIVSGDPVLAQAALDAVKQWVYAPTLVNGAPVNVITAIEIEVAPTSGEK